MRIQTPFSVAICLAALLTASVATAQESDAPAESPDHHPGPTAASDCPREFAENPCIIDLETGKTTGPCAEPASPFYSEIPKVADSNDDGWLETVVPVNLSEGCESVCVVLDYTETPTGWTLNFGDSSINNGYGGGGPENSAELEILNQRLRIWSKAYGAGLIDQVANADLQLGDGSYKVCVSDQFASFGQPLSSSASPNGRAIFALPDPYDGNSDLFIGLNRVIGNLGGSPSGGRVGTGLRRAYITME